MALVTFGSTARAGGSLTLTNTTTGNLSFGLLHGGFLNVGASISYTFDYLDNALSSINLRNSDLYNVNATGGLYLNDIAELALLLTSGKVVAHAASFNQSTGVFTTTNTPLASAVYGDGSVIFS